MSKRYLLSIVIWKQIIYFTPYNWFTWASELYSTIARWRKVCLKNAAVDTYKFQVHSVRAAATSKACLSGLTVEDILKPADW